MRYGKNELSDHIDFLGRRDFPGIEVGIDGFEGDAFMQPGLVALFVWIGIHGSTVSLDSIPIASGFAIVLHQYNFYVVRWRYIAPESAETTVRDNRRHRAAFDVSYEHVPGNPDGAGRHLDPTLGFYFCLLFAKPARRRSKAVQGKMGPEMKCLWDRTPQWISSVDHFRPRTLFGCVHCGFSLRKRPQ